MIDAKLAALEVYYKTHGDSDERAAAIDRFNAEVPTGCASAAQLTRLGAITQGTQDQSVGEANSPFFNNPLAGALDALWTKMLPVLKIAAGGTGLLVVGAALVYVAGRNTQTGRGVTGAAKVSGKVVGSVVPASVKEARSEASSRRASSRADLARARVVTTTSRKGKERVRVTSRREGRRSLLAEDAARHEAAQGRRRDRAASASDLPGIGQRTSRRRSTADLRAV